jgi:hypothetical protein
VHHDVSPIHINAASNGRLISFRQLETSTSVTKDRHS